MGVWLQERDIEIFRYMATFGFVTVNQLCSLLDPNGKGASKDTSAYKAACYKRLEALSREGLIYSAPAPSVGGPTIKGYFLSTSGASAFADVREVEYMGRGNWAEKKSHFVWTQGPHDLAAGNFVANLVALSRLDGGFSIDSVRGGRDCRYHIPAGESSYLFNPDLFFEHTIEGRDPMPMFVEIDTGHLSLQVIRRKALRLSHYFGSGAYVEEFGDNLFPRTLFIFADGRRLRNVAGVLAKSREAYRGPNAKLVRPFPMWLSTYEDVDINAVDENRVIQAPLGPNWKNLDGETGISPFNY